MIRRKTTIALTLFFLLASSLRQSVAEGKTTNRVTNRVSCDPVGRVLSRGFLNFASGSLLCKGDRLQVVNATKAELLCFPSGRIVTVTDHLEDASKCGSSVERRWLWRCAAEFTPHSCVLPSNNPVLISPYGHALIDGRPFISWQPVVKATSYIVEIDGSDVRWQKTVDGTTLPYPKEQPAMQFGNAYKVNVITYQADSPVSASSAVLNVLPESEAQQVRTILKRIQSLNLSPDEEARDNSF